jgi:hypothetical protein
VAVEYLAGETQACDWGFCGGLEERQLGSEQNFVPALLRAVKGFVLNFDLIPVDFLVRWGMLWSGGSIARMLAP